VEHAAAPRGRNRLSSAGKRRLTPNRCLIPPAAT
jgi:hypothetical protein